MTSIRRLLADLDRVDAFVWGMVAGLFVTAVVGLVLA